MEIESTLTNRAKQILKVMYKESDPSKDVAGVVLQVAHAYCFYKDALVVVYAENKGYWTPPGGGIDPGESIAEAVIREVKEEANMKVLYQELIGYQDIFEPSRVVRHTRSFCIVEPYGDFVSDPDGDVTEIKMIDPRDYKEYFDWGKIGDRIMAQAIAMKQKFMEHNAS